jgi:adhesin/invasin
VPAAGNQTLSATFTPTDTTDYTNAAGSTTIAVVGPFSLAKSAIALSAPQVASGGTVSVTLTAKDADGNQELSGGLTVKFALGTGNARGTFGTVTDNKNGTYTATFKGTTAGSNTITAAIGGHAVTSTPPTVTVVGTFNLARSAVTVSPAQIVSGGTSTVTLTAKDANGNRELSGGLTVKFALGTGNARGTFSTVTDNKNGTYTATFKGTTAGSNTVTATIGGQAVTSTPPKVTVTTASSATATPSLGAASANGPATDAVLRALLLDDSTTTGKPRPLLES